MAEIRDRVKELRRVPASEIRENPRNWRRHPASQRAALQGVLSEIGFADALIVRELDDGTLELVDGHLRREEMGDQLVPVLVLDVNQREAAQLLLTIDPLAMMAENDTDALLALLQDTEFKDKAVTDLLEAVVNGERWPMPDLTEPIVQDDPGPQIDKAEELREKWGVERGQVWEIGAHRLMCGEVVEDLRSFMEGKRCPMVWTDPPYDGALGGAGFRATPDIRERVQKMQDSVKAMYSFDPSQALTIIESVITKPASLFFFSNKALVPSYINFAVDTGRKFDILLWHKPNYLPMAGKHYYLDTEYLTKIADHGATFINGLGVEGVHYGTYWVLESLKGSGRDVGGQHPTIKPLVIAKDCIAICSYKGDVILDPFLGSGTTMVAAEQLGRICYGMEIEPKYVAVTLERMAGMGLEPRLANG